MENISLCESWWSTKFNFTHFIDNFIVHLRSYVIYLIFLTFSALLAICAGNSSVTGEIPTQRPVSRSFDVFFDLRLINGWVNIGEAGDLRRHFAHYDITVMTHLTHLTHLRSWIQSIYLLLVLLKSDNFCRRYSKFHIWPWKFKVKHLAKVKPDGHMWSLEFDRHVCSLSVSWQSFLAEI